MVHVRAAEGGLGPRSGAILCSLEGSIHGLNTSRIP